MISDIFLVLFGLCVYGCLKSLDLFSSPVTSVLRGMVLVPPIALDSMDMFMILVLQISEQIFSFC